MPNLKSKCCEKEISLSFSCRFICLGCKQFCEVEEKEEKCHLTYVDGYLTCTYNHKEGESCLMDRESEELRKSYLASPTQTDEEWEKEFDKKFDYSGSITDDDGFSILTDKADNNPVGKDQIIDFIRQLLSTAKQEERERVRKMVEGLIGRHNAEILNEFQLQGTPEMPMIAYDERVCLMPAIRKATERTLSDLLKKLE